MSDRLPGLGHDGCLTPLSIDRVLYDPPGSAGLSQLQQHADGCARCQQRLAEARAFDSGVTLAPPPGLDWTGHVSAHTSDRIQIEQALAEGELRYARMHLERCETCQDMVQAKAHFDAENALKPPAQVLARAGESQRAGAGGSPESGGAEVITLSSRRKLLSWAAPAAGLLAAALALFMLAPPASDVHEPLDGRLKGSDFGAAFYVHDGEKARRVSSGDTVRGGDRIGFQLQAQRAGHVLIVGVDSGGQVYVCHPQDTNGASRIYAASGEVITVNEAMRFDDAPGYERLVALHCPAPFSVDQVRPALAGHGKTLAPDTAAVTTLPALLDGCAQREIVLKKVRKDGQNEASPGVGSGGVQR